ncbi:MAG: nucleotidyltransferase domain-containing protein [Bacteroidota bacterium]
MKIEQIEELKKELEEAVKRLLSDKLKKIVLYGSYARGDYDKESDIDFAVIASVTLQQINEYDDELADICLDLSLKYDVLVSVMIISEENFNGYHEILPCYSNLVKEGIPIYGIQ